MLFCYKLFEYIWGFIVQSVQLRFESSIFKYLEDFGIGVFDRVFSAVRYQFGKDGIAFNIKDNKEVIIAADWWYNKFACLISAYFASDGLTNNVSVMSTQTWCFFAWRKKWQWRGVKHVSYCVVAEYNIKWFPVIGNAMNETGRWCVSVYIFVKRWLLGSTNVGSLCMHMDFDCGFRN